MWRSAVQLCAGLLKRTTRKGRRRGGLAQLARAPALQAGGQRFESVILHCPGQMTKLPNEQINEQMVNG